ncbi:MAG: S9 family peptidase [Steroidobacteraceae bacterium]|jgi:dipeptidyl aminopeptidase/acylaminoacyl peptidase|nr:S9 family peptidase [Steroidobacteraceae bacterium]
MNLIRAGAVVALWLAAGCWTLPAQAAAELLPRADIFGNPERTSATISPDGRTLAFLAPREGVLNVWVAPVGDLAAAKPVTSETVRPIRQFSWAPDSSRILYVQDKGGDENYLLYGVDLEGKETRSYTPFEKTRVLIYAISPEVKDAILVGVNNRDPRLHDVHRLDLRTGELSLVYENPGWAGFEFDRQLNLRLAVRQTPGGGFEVHRFEADGKTVPFMNVGPEDSLTTSTVGFTSDGKTLYLVDSRGRDTAALVAMDFGSGEQSVIGQHAKADVAGALADPATGRIQAFSANYLKSEWAPIGDALAGDIAFLNERTGGNWSVASQSHDNRFWTLGVDRGVEPYAFYLYDRQKKSLERLFTTRPKLEGRTLARMYPLELSSRDGLTLVSYLSLPPGSDPDGDGVPDKPLPMVLNVHGGPWARDEFGYDSEHQWLANRGYAVLAVNYRGSTGFGKSFLNAANGEFAGKMHDDLIDAVRWAIDRKVTTADKVAIYGGSYGGYATLVGMTFTPETFACGVDIVGPSNLVTLIESFPAYWQPFMEATWYKRVGDPRTEAGRKDLLARSPLTRVDQIRRPLLIAQGANDPRVTKLESDQLAAAMVERKIPVTYVLYPDEGHGFAVPENRISFYAVSEAFLSRCLGGRFQPVGGDFQGASLQVLEGADFVPGLAEALKATFQ